MLILFVVWTVLVEQGQGYTASKWWKPGFLKSWFRSGVSKLWLTGQIGPVFIQLAS